MNTDKNKDKSVCFNIGRRDFLKSGVLGTTLAVAGCFDGNGVALNEPEKKPNILFILTDQQHIDAIAASGNTNLKTPNIDKLCREGTMFRQSYTTNPVCLPARSSIFTGRMPVETGCWINHTGVCKDGIRKTIPNMGQWFSQQGGYETIYAGKWHCPEGFTYDIDGFRVISSGIDWQSDVSDAMVSRACEDYIYNRKSSQPFLMVASLHQPHDICIWRRLNLKDREELLYKEIADDLPELPDNFGSFGEEPEDVKAARYVDWSPQHWQYYMWSYYRHVEMVDEEIGRLLRALEETGTKENTLIVFSSDHGDGVAHHQMQGKGWLYDESAKVPLIFSFPSRIKENKIDSESLTSVIDIMPTLCDFAGLATPEGVKGMSLKPALLGDDIIERDCIVAEAVTKHGYRSKSANDSGRMVRSMRYKYIKYNGDDIEQLFDMKADPGEKTNLAGDKVYTDQLNKHRTLLKEWEKSLSIDPRVMDSGYPWV